MIKICEIFKSIQGEGKYIGTPMLFIRVSGCTRKCDFCDTSYHTKGRNITVKALIKRINQSKLRNICWTGGEPLLYKEEIYQVMARTSEKRHHLETNGDLLTIFECSKFFHISCSPKTKKTAFKIYSFPTSDISIKVVTDLKINKELIKYAQYLMPLTTYHPEEDKAIERKVWNYCIKNNIKYTPRIHVDVWGQKRKI